MGVRAYYNQIDGKYFDKFKILYNKGDYFKLSPFIEDMTPSKCPYICLENDWGIIEKLIRENVGDSDENKIRLTKLTIYGEGQNPYDGFFSYLSPTTLNMCARFLQKIDLYHFKEFSEAILNIFESDYSYQKDYNLHKERFLLEELKDWNIEDEEFLVKELKEKLKSRLTLDRLFFNMRTKINDDIIVKTEAEEKMKSEKEYLNLVERVELIYLKYREFVDFYQESNQKHDDNWLYVSIN